MSPTADEARTGILVATAAYVFWGLATVFWKQLEHFDAFELIAYRITSCSIVMLIATATTGQLRRLLGKLRDPALLGRVTIAALVLTVNWTTYVWAVVHDRVLETALGYFMSPIGLMIAGVVVLKERMTRAQTAALVLAVAAVVVLTIGYGRVPWVSLIIATTWVIYNYVKKHSPLGAVESLAAETFVLVVPAVIGVVLETVLRTDSAAHTASSGQWVLLALTGVITAIPLSMFAFAAQRLTMIAMGLVVYIVPTINFLLGWLAYHEHLDGTRVVGFALVWIGLAAVTLDSVRHRLRPTGAVELEYSG